MAFLLNIAKLEDSVARALQPVVNSPSEGFPLSGKPLPSVGWLVT